MWKKPTSVRQATSTLYKKPTCISTPARSLVLFGLSGAGKSTLIRCINMLEVPTGGQVFVDGQELTAMNNQQLRKARQNIGMIFQHFNLLTSQHSLR